MALPISGLHGSVDPPASEPRDARARVRTAGSKQNGRELVRGIPGGPGPARGNTTRVPDIARPVHDSDPGNGVDIDSWVWLTRRSRGFPAKAGTRRDTAWTGQRVLVILPQDHISVFREGVRMPSRFGVGQDTGGWGRHSSCASTSPRMLPSRTARRSRESRSFHPSRQHCRS